VKTILLNGPGFDPEAATSGGMGGYVRNMQVYLSEFDSDRYKLVHAPTTVRKKGEGWLRKVPRLGQDLLSVRRRLSGASGVHMMALYRSALPREVAIAAMLKARGVPYVYEIKAGAFIRFVEGSSAPVRKATEWLVRNAGEVLCEGEDYVRWLNDEWGVESTWFPNFVPDHEIPAEVSERFQGETISALFVGHVYEGKGVYELMEGARVAAASGVRLKVTIIGHEAPAFSEWADVFESEVGDLPLTIDRKGLQPHAAVIATLKAHDVFVFPSAHPGEGHSNAVNEAMMCGCAVVSTRHGFLPSVLKDSAVFLDDRTPESIAAALKQLAADRDGARSLAHAARKRLLDHYRAGQVLPILEATYDRLTAS
jgi:glycosyltransferase involved in cell wall biosynthesis